MDFLLKIVEGPMKGAEVALVAGTRVKVGSSDQCDVVLADATLPEIAFELDVSEDRLTLLKADGSQDEIRPFELYDFGTTVVAFGPAGETWPALKRPEPKAAEPDAAAAAEPAAEPAAAEASLAEAAPEEAAPSPAEPADAGEKKRGGFGCGCFVWILVLLLLLAVAAVAAWFFHPPSRARMEDCWTKVRAVWAGGRSDAPAAAKAGEDRSASSLVDLAREHNLSLTTADGVPLLKGNFRRRTERLAVRALARAADAACRFDLTDDETLLRGAADLLFAYTDGAIKADVASNRVVAISGFAPSPEALERAVRALNADVSGIERLDTSRVTVGGTAPPRLARTEFVRQGDETLEEIEEREIAQRKQRQRLRRPKAPAAASPDYPIAGVLTKPYACVVMRNGHRVMEGALIGSATLVKISADELTLREGTRTFTWRP